MFKTKLPSQAIEKAFGVALPERIRNVLDGANARRLSGAEIDDVENIDFALSLSCVKAHHAQDFRDDLDGQLDIRACFPIARADHGGGFVYFTVDLTKAALPVRAFQVSDGFSDLEPSFEQFLKRLGVS